MPTKVGQDAHATKAAPPSRASLAERILTIPVRHEDLMRPVELVDAVRRDLALELGAEVDVTWLDPDQVLAGTAGADGAGQERADGTPEATPESTSPATSFELRKRGVAVAYLSIVRPEPLSDEELRLVGFLARDVSHWLTEASKRIETRLVTALSTTLPTCESLDEAARVSVFTIVERLGAEAGMLLIRGESGFRSLAEMGTWSDDDASRRERFEIAEACAHTYGPRVHAGSIVAAPVGSIMPARYVLLLKVILPDPRQATGFPTLMQAARVLEPHLSARWRALVLGELLQLGQASLGASTESMYAEALETAVRLVPGADSGFLLVRHDAQEPFVFNAVHGNVAADVLGRSVTSERAFTWYGSDANGWQNGHARIMRHGDAEVASLADLDEADSAGSPDPEPGLEGEPITQRAQAGLSLPVVFDASVLALLCLENQTEPDAFGRDSREIAEMFGSPLAGLLQRQRTHDLLMHAAVTDSLTGLSNRRAFDEILQRELARTERSGAALSVLLMDMANFKEINDVFGHEAGDEALVAVAATLRASVRDGDYLFRWGGDEFAAILVDEADRLTENTAERLRAAVPAVEFRDRKLRIDVGWAEAPADGRDAVTLLRVADERMYENKRSA